MFESPVLDEVNEILRQRYEEEFRQRYEKEYRERYKKEFVQQGRMEAQREVIILVLTTRFTAVPADVRAKLEGIADPARLDALVRLAATCPDTAAFAAQL